MEYTSSSPGNDAEFVVVNEVSAYSSKDLADFNKKYGGSKLPPGSVVRGYTGRTPSGYTPYRNFTAKNLSNPMILLEVQIHELGNSLSAITSAANNENIKVTNPGNILDPDAGAKLQKCVREGKGFKY